MLCVRKINKRSKCFFWHSAAISLIVLLLSPPGKSSMFQGTQQLLPTGTGVSAGILLLQHKPCDQSLLVIKCGKMRHNLATKECVRSSAQSLLTLAFKETAEIVCEPKSISPRQQRTSFGTRLYVYTGCHAHAHVRCTARNAGASVRFGPTVVLQHISGTGSQHSALLGAPCTRCRTPRSRNMCGSVHRT